MDFGLIVRTAGGRPQIFTTAAVPTTLCVDLMPEVGTPEWHREVRLCPAELEKLARAGIKFDPSDAHHRVMIDKYLAELGLAALTGDEWSQIRRHYRSLKRRAR